MPVLGKSPLSDFQRKNIKRLKHVFNCSQKYHKRVYIYTVLNEKIWPFCNAPTCNHVLERSFQKSCFSLSVFALNDIVIIDTSCASADTSVQVLLLQGVLEYGSSGCTLHFLEKKEKQTALENSYEIGNIHCTCRPYTSVCNGIWNIFLIIDAFIKVFMGL